jgi:hypothetical protein
MKRLQNPPLIECLEPRLMLSGEWVGYQLEVTTLGGTAVSAVEVGQDFKVSAYAQDLRANPQGVFAAYLDVAFNQAMAHPSGGISHTGSSYANGLSGDTLTLGTLDEAGGFSGLTTLGAGRKLIFSEVFHADAVGNVTFSGNPADLSPGHDTLVYGSNSVVGPSQILYGQTVLHILASAKPTAGLTHPGSGATIDQPTINVAERYIDVTYADLSGSGIKGSTITDAGDEFTLSGTAAGGVIVNGAATLVSGTTATYRYTFTGDFDIGDVTVTYIVGNFADNAGNLAGVQADQDFTVASADHLPPTADLTAPADGATIGDTVFNGRHYIDVTFADLGGSGLDVGTITDSNAEFTLGGLAAAGVQVNGAGTLVAGTTSTYRYTFTGSFAPGAVTVDFIAGSVADTAGNPLAATSEGFSVAHVDTVPPMAALTDPADGTEIGDIDLNARGYIDVTFTDDPGGSGIDPATITDAAREFSVSGVGANGVILDGVPTLVAGTVSTYRYRFTGSFEAGTVNVYFTAGGFADLQANPNQGRGESFTVLAVDNIPPTASLADPADRATAYTSELNARGYIDVTFTDRGPSGLDLATITDAGAEFTLGGAGAGVAVDGAAALVDGTTYRYTFTGAFVDGQVSVDFLDGTWVDLAGNPNSAASEGFTTVSGQPEIVISGNGLPVIVDGDTTPSLVDGTDFGAGSLGAAVVHVFTIANTGTAPVGLTGLPRVQVTGAAAADFVVTVQPDARVVDGGSTFFSLRFTPSFTGLRTATITVTNTDSDEGSYTFNVQGVGGRMQAFGGRTKATYTDASGDAVTVGLAGAGTGEVWFANVNAGIRADAYRILLKSTNSSSALSVSATGALKRTSLTYLNVMGAFKQIDASCLTITGGVYVSGTLGGMSVDGLKGATVEVHRLATAAVNRAAQLVLQANDVTDTTLNTYGQAIKSITVWEWADADAHPNDAIISSWIGTLTTTGRKEQVGGLAGDFAADLDLGKWRDHLSAKLPAATLGVVKIAGDLRASTWTIAGSLGDMTVGGIVSTTIRTLSGGMGALTFGGANGADLLAGVNTLAAGDPTVVRHADSVHDLNLSLGIKSLTITGVTGADPATSSFKNSNFSAGSIGAVALVNVTYDAGPVGRHVADQFGFWAGSIKSVTCRNLVKPADTWTWPKQLLTAAQVDLTVQRLV